MTWGVGWGGGEGGGRRVTLAHLCVPACSFLAGSLLPALLPHPHPRMAPGTVHLGSGVEGSGWAQGSRGSGAGG